MTYRPCPSFPGYSAALNGSIRRDSWIKITKTGKRIEQPASVIKHLEGRHSVYVTLGGKFVRWSEMVADAWPAINDGRPESDYPDGRVITVEEWYARHLPA